MTKRFHVDPHETVDIFEDGADGNVITIRARMNVEIVGRVKDTMDALNAAAQTEGALGVTPAALLLHNILAWRGPDFADLPCTSANIGALPSPQLDPFIEKVLNAIGERNSKRASPNERSPATPSTSGSAGAAGSIARFGSDPSSRPSANGILRSPLLSAAIGHQNRSDD